eukprot:TRINITY_DN914_c1_g1_i1.p1 TRINITY_DN914_c1_g1~~TRINITY_DN914_c1_g1_i1.p1  ORF type:complete len:895 (+),score=109.92 TRINITY_DN914_c1_g1_i1:54-2738(+)
MNELLDKVLYKGEWTAGNSSLNLLERCKASGGIIVENVGKKGVVGVKFHESLYTDSRRSDLAIGARTLYIKGDRPNEIALRGLNKFPDYEDVSHLLLNPQIQQQLSPLRIQRKIAGFLVVISASEYEPDLIISSKHVLKGKHVTSAQRLLHQEWGYKNIEENASKLRSFLIKHSVSLVCEGVDAVEDTWHPISEPVKYQGINILCVLNSNTLREETRNELLQDAVTASSGIKVAPGIENPTWSQISEHINRCDHWDETNTATEGYVLTFAINTNLVRQHFSLPESTEASPSQTLFRVKLKTVRYKVQRQLRHLISKITEKGSDMEIVRRWEYLSPYQKVMVSFICDKQPQVFHQKQCDVTKLVQSLEDSFDAEQRAAWNDLVPHLRPVVKASDHILLMPVGLPGSGKTTFLSKIPTDATFFKGYRVVYLSKDDITMEEQLRQQKQDVTRSVHHRILHILHFIVEQAKDPLLVIVDGCNLTKGSRKMLSNVLPRCITINFDTNFDSCVDRAEKRTSHPTLAADSAKVVITSMQAKISFESQSANQITVTPETVDASYSKLRQMVHQMMSVPSPDCPPSPLMNASSVKSFFSCDASQLLSKLGLKKPIITNISTLSHVGICPTSNPSSWATQIIPVVKSVIKKTCGPNSCGSESLLSSLLGWTSNFFGQKSTLKVTDNSNEQWLKGSLEKIRFKKGGNQNLFDVLVDHYNLTTYTDKIHCTLVHVGGKIPEDDGDRNVLMRVNQKRAELQEKDAIIHCDRLVIDNKGICLGVSNVGLLVWPNGWSSPLQTPLGFLPKSAHVTLGVIKKEDSSYCNTLISTLSEWNDQNTHGSEERKARKKLKRRKSDYTAEFHTPDQDLPEEPRRKVKFHNSVEVKIDPPIQLKGVVRYFELDQCV